MGGRKAPPERDESAIPCLSAVKPAFTSRETFCSIWLSQGGVADIVSRYKWHFRLFKNRTLSVAAIVAFLFGTALEADHLGRNVEPRGVSGFATLIERSIESSHEDRVLLL